MFYSLCKKTPTTALLYKRKLVTSRSSAQVFTKSKFLDSKNFESLVFGAFIRIRCVFQGRMELANPFIHVFLASFKKHSSMLVPYQKLRIS
jgi:hypothetical protein